MLVPTDASNALVIAERRTHMKPDDRFNAVDPTLSAWAAKHSLLILRRYRDEEVRSIDVTRNGAEQSYQLWIDPPAGSSITVHVWNRRAWRRSYETTLANLTSALDAAIGEIYRHDQSAS